MEKAEWMNPLIIVTFKIKNTATDPRLNHYKFKRCAA